MLQWGYLSTHHVSHEVVRKVTFCVASGRTLAMPTVTPLGVLPLASSTGRDADGRNVTDANTGTTVESAGEPKLALADDTELVDADSGVGCVVLRGDNDRLNGLP